MSLGVHISPFASGSDMAQHGTGLCKFNILFITDCSSLVLIKICFYLDYWDFCHSLKLSAPVEYHTHLTLSQGPGYDSQGVIINSTCPSLLGEGQCPYDSERGPGGKVSATQQRQ